MSCPDCFDDEAKPCLCRTPEGANEVCRRFWQPSAAETALVARQIYELRLGTAKHWQELAETAAGNARAAYDVAVRRVGP